jgi:hypothetical protein
VTSLQQLVDFVHNTIQGFDDSTAKSLLSLLGRQLGQLRTRKDDVANWPNVRTFPGIIGMSELTAGSPFTTLPGKLTSKI